MIRAIIWDADGTLSETDETHRAAFNETFRAFAVDWSWDRATYRRMMHHRDDRDRLRAYAEEHQTELDEDQLRRMQADTAHRTLRLIQLGAAPLRPGVREVIAAARSLGIRHAIAADGPLSRLQALLHGAGADPTAFEVMALSGGPTRRKPAPDVFYLALEQLAMPATDCVAIEDSAAGLAAARSAGLRVMVTPSVHTAGQDFGEASWVAPDLTGPLPGALACLNGALGHS